MHSNIHHNLLPSAKVMSLGDGQETRYKPSNTQPSPGSADCFREILSEQNSGLLSGCGRKYSSLILLLDMYEKHVTPVASSSQTVTAREASIRTEPRYNNKGEVKVLRKTIKWKPCLNYALDTSHFWTSQLKLANAFLLLYTF